MSFTQDELESLNSVVERKLREHRHELERALDQRLHILERGFEQRIALLQQEYRRHILNALAQQHQVLQDALIHRLEAQQVQLTQTMLQEQARQQQIQSYVLERLVKNAIESESNPVEQWLAPSLSHEGNKELHNHHHDLDGFEVQTEVAWDDLVHLINKALDERFTTLEHSTRASFKDLEHYLLVRLQSLREEFTRTPYEQSYAQTASETPTHLQDVFAAIEQLERLIESMQVAMTSHHTLLSNRLYHHQQLPLERAHPRSDATEPSLPAVASAREEKS